MVYNGTSYFKMIWRYPYFRKNSNFVWVCLSTECSQFTGSKEDSTGEIRACRSVMRTESAENGPDVAVGGSELEAWFGKCKNIRSWSGRKTYGRLMLSCNYLQFGLSISFLAVCSSLVGSWQLLDMSPNQIHDCWCAASGRRTFKTSGNGTWVVKKVVCMLC